MFIAQSRRSKDRASTAHYTIMRVATDGLSTRFFVYSNFGEAAL